MSCQEQVMSGLAKLGVLTGRNSRGVRLAWRPPWSPSLLGASSAVCSDGAEIR